MSTSRRHFLARSGAALITAAAAAAGTRAAPVRAVRADLTALSAAQAVERMRDGSLSAESYANALLDQARRWQGLNAFLALDPESVREAARQADRRRASGARLGRLHGLPLPVKDSINTRAMPTTQGTRALAHFQPQRNAAILEPLLAAGALLMGKTNLHELSCGWSSNNLAFGPVLNPYDRTRSPGGSSGGSAAVVAARIAPIALGEDTFGSIRVPASFCGVAGLRPTQGRYPDSGTMPLSFSRFDQLGTLARCVGDLALFDAVITGDPRPLRPRSLHGLRIGYDAEFFSAGIDAQVGEILEHAFERLRSAGVRILNVRLPAAARAASVVEEAFFSYELLDSMAQFLAAERTGVSLEELIAQASPNLQPLLEQSRTHGTQAHYEDLLRQLSQIRSGMQQFLQSQSLDALAFAPSMMPAFEQGDPQTVRVGDRELDLLTAIGRNEAVGSCAGLSCLVLSAGQTRGGLPVGLELDAPAGADRQLLSMGLALERVLGPLPAPRLD